MTDGVTPLGGLAGLLSRVTMSGGVTIYHVNVSRWGNPPSGVTFVSQKDQISQTKAKHECVKTFYIS